jgi:hypothetical protein
MRSILWAVAAAAILAGGSASAFAQGGRYDGRQHYYRSSDYAPRAHRHYYRSPGFGPTTCGEFHYWKDGRCVDARVVAPDLSRPRR